MIDGLPTSPLGMTIAKRCKWCRSIMQPTPVGDKNNFGYSKFSTSIFCSEDCRIEEQDWRYVTSKTSKTTINERRLKDYHTKPKVDRKEYFRKLYLKKKKEGKLLWQTNRELHLARVAKSKEKKKLLSVSIVKSL